MARRHRYSSDELEEYFTLPSPRRIHDVTHRTASEQLDFLTLLHKHHLCKCPWENLVHHYSWHRVVNLHPAHLFTKIVRQPGRGGSGIELNYFHHLILYSLGFTVYMCGARLYSPSTDAYGGWTHCINLVTIGAQPYLLDGGIGASEPHRPIPLIPSQASPQIAPAETRLLHEPIRETLHPSHQLWILQHRPDPASAWTPRYCFPDCEFTPADITAMNPSAPALTLPPHHVVVAVRFSTERELNGPQGPGSPDEAALASPLDGTITLHHDTLTWRRRGRKVVEWTLKGEDERVQALEMYFGITLREEDREGIGGTAAMLGPVTDQGGRWII